jgi:hypothetical protein
MKTSSRDETTYRKRYITHMAYDVQVSDEFREWYEPLDESEQDSIGRVVGLLEQRGPALPYPYSSGIQGSALGHMRELRIQHEGCPYRVLYAFDPTRSAYLLIGGDKTGDGRWYETNVPRAERIYSQHLSELEDL